MVLGISNGAALNQLSLKEVKSAEYHQSDQLAMFAAKPQRQTLRLRYGPVSRPPPLPPVRQSLVVDVAATDQLSSASHRSL